MSPNDKKITTVLALMYMSGFLYVLGGLYIIAVRNTVTMNDMLVFAPGLLVQLISLFFAKRLNGK